jgi:NAD(P)-dependent dehydrogenase (short-subunit alcohol dehydrogenase family)
VNRYDLEGRVALVTGASAGLGAEFCRGLAASGAHLVLAARRRELLEQVAVEVHDRHRVRTLVVRSDVAEEEDVIGMVRAAVDEFGRLDVLVNNAGTLIAKPVVEQTLDDWNRVMTVNLTSAFLASREAAKVMIGQGSGAIVNISSIFAFAATNEFQEVSYYASKGGMTMLTKALAVELGKDNIRVNAIAPGFFPTDIATGVTSEVRENLILPRTAVPETARNEWIRGALCFLASDDAAFITGETLVVDGGHLAY